AQGRNKRGSTAEAEMGQAFLSIMRHGWGDEHSAFMKAFSSVFFPNGSAEQIKWLVDLQRITTSPENAIRIRSACDDIDVVDLLPQVKVPTLVLHCRHDNVAPFEQGRLRASSIPHAKFVTLESDNHVVLAGEPAWPRLVGEIEAFLRERGLRKSLRRHSGCARSAQTGIHNPRPVIMDSGPGPSGRPGMTEEILRRRLDQLA